MSGDVLVRCSYFRQPDGTYIEVRYIGRRIVWVETFVPFFRLMTGDWPWEFDRSPSLALVKEGPKALVLASHFRLP